LGIAARNFKTSQRRGPTIGAKKRTIRETLEHTASDLIVISIEGMTSIDAEELFHSFAQGLTAWPTESPN